MTRGQLAQLQDLSGCYGLRRFDANFVQAWRFYVTEADRMGKREKGVLRRLTHQYRNQIAAMKRNEKK